MVVWVSATVHVIFVELDRPRESVAVTVTGKACERIPCRRSVVAEAAFAGIVPLTRPFDADRPAGRPETVMVTPSPSWSFAENVTDGEVSSLLLWLLALMVGAWFAAGAGAGAGLPAWVPPFEPPVFPPAGAGAGALPRPGTVPVPPVVPPPGTEPPGTEPPGPEPPGTEPPGTEPPDTEPPGTEPGRAPPSGREATTGVSTG